MKRIILGALVVVSSVLISCNPNSPSPTSGVMNCLVDGQLWESTNASGIIQNGIMNVTGQITSTGELITITFDDDIVGSYGLGPNEGNAAIYKESLTATSSYASHTTGGSGIASVDEIDVTNKTITGTFEFEGKEPVSGTVRSITDGIFTELAYIEEASATFNNSFTANVDGVAFSPTLIYGSSNFGTISITASENGSFPSIGLSVPSTVTTGTYDLSSFGSYRGIYNFSNGQNDMYSANGTGITITSHNTTTKVIEGTFSFTAEPNLGSTSTTNFSISNGTFSIEY